MLLMSKMLNPKWLALGHQVHYTGCRSHYSMHHALRPSIQNGSLFSGCTLHMEQTLFLHTSCALYVHYIVHEVLYWTKSEAMNPIDLVLGDIVDLVLQIEYTEYYFKRRISDSSKGIKYFNENKTQAFQRISRFHTSPCLQMTPRQSMNMRASAQQTEMRVVQHCTLPGVYFTTSETQNHTVS